MDRHRVGYITAEDIKRDCAVDINRDGYITEQEATQGANPWLALLRSQDRNGDGRISLDELLQFNNDTKQPRRPPPAANPYGYGGPGGPGGYPPPGGPAGYPPPQPGAQPSAPFGYPPASSGYPPAGQPPQGYYGAPGAPYGAASQGQGYGAPPFGHPQQYPPPGALSQQPQYGHPQAPGGGYPPYGGYPAPQYAQQGYAPTNPGAAPPATQLDEQQQVLGYGLGMRLV
eukprot:CAMPEP_0202904042 /NCGR_PEP_ID=MMETSP1392-20130828/27629_1 /ASSEMBLY_ACC=CAM_ASM_000868 /TAXON_ID=225041 /ORGANISM="Chlamydomonas chlamydogama, Strain SAG 11-48b" /LENGTH=228 /DNA_ID=CAMNT_0049591495 /DNA_START=299 /DNA_END=986 /DNA_ORIENTATION=-